jgi:hypothetical protein
VNPNIPLDNTHWKGSFTYLHSVTDILDRFIPGNRNFLTEGTLSFPSAPYSRSSSGGAIHTDQGIFCVIISDTEMKGSYNSSEYVVDMVKQ